MYQHLQKTALAGTIINHYAREISLNCKTTTFGQTW